MMQVMDEIMKQHNGIGLAIIFSVLASVYVVVKTTVWWVLFGTFRLLFRKYSLYEWLMRTLGGLAVFAALIVVNLILLYGFAPDNVLYLGLVVVSGFLALRVWLREILSLCGLLRGDWNPFHPELRFLAWHETYIFSLFGRHGGMPVKGESERSLDAWAYDSYMRGLQKQTGQNYGY